MNEKTKKRKLALYTTLEVIGVLIITVVGNLWDWVNLRFTLDRIQDWKFWSDVIIQTIMYSSALMIGYLVKIERLELNDETFHTGYNRYLELLKNKKDSFVSFIDIVFNPNTKKKFIKKRAQNKLYKLDEKSKDNWKITYQRLIRHGDYDTFEWPLDKKGNIDKKTKAYCDRRIELEKLASDDYINENWEFISQKYPRINPNAFTEHLGVHFNDYSEYKVENETAKELPKRFVGKVVASILFAFVIGLILWDPSANELLEQAYGWLVLILKYVIRVSMVVINLIMGLYFAKKIFQDNFILPVENRCRILKEYINWNHENQVEDTYADKFIQSYQEREKQIKELQELIQSAENLNKN